MKAEAVTGGALVLNHGGAPLFSGGAVVGITLRQYQSEAIDALRAVWDRRPILVSPTGSGKTVMSCAVISSATARGARVLFLAHRKELIEQAAARLADWGIVCGVIKAGVAPSPMFPVQVASVQTLVRREKPPADIVIIDECHLAAARTYRSILDCYPDAAVIGLTGTPCRLDGQGLGDLFGELVIAATPAELAKQGHIGDPRIFVGREKPDLKGVKIVAGDYAKGETGLRMTKPKLIADIVDSWRKLAEGRRTIVFASSLDHSRELVGRFRDAGVEAAHLDGATPNDERTEILERLQDGRLTLVSNFGVLVEGFDCPALECVVLARPTKSLTIYLQSVGRALRPDGARPLILDHGGLVELHGHPLADRIWSLDGTVRRSTGEAALPLRLCEECFAMISASEREQCPECGADLPAPPPPKPEKMTDGEMVELLHSPKTFDRRRAYVEIVKKASAKGFSIGWARNQYREHTTVWPQFWAVEKEHYRPLGEPITRHNVATASLQHTNRSADQLGDDYERLTGVDRDCEEWRHLAAFACWIKREARNASCHSCWPDRIEVIRENPGLLNDRERCAKCNSVIRYMPEHEQRQERKAREMEAAR